MSKDVLGGIVMDYPLNKRSKKNSICLALLQLKLLVLLNLTKSAAKLCSVMQKNGKQLLKGWDVGSIFPKHGRRWTSLSWKVSGGFSNNSTKKVLFTRGLR